MFFHPNLQQELRTYRIAEHPAAPGMPYGPESRQAVVYQLPAPDGGKRALKVLKTRYRLPALAGLADKLASFAALPGLAVCRRTILTLQRHATLLRQYPDVICAVLTAWVDGRTWTEVMLDRRGLTPTQSLALARSLVEVLSSMEQKGLAHCDLSGPNVLLPALAGGTFPIPIISTMVGDWLHPTCPIPMAKGVASFPRRESRRNDTLVQTEQALVA